MGRLVVMWFWNLCFINLGLISAGICQLVRLSKKYVSMFVYRWGSIYKSNTILPTIQMLLVPPVTGGQPQLKHVWLNILLTRIPSLINLPGVGEGIDEKSSTVEKKALTVL